MSACGKLAFVAALNVLIVMPVAHASRSSFEIHPNSCSSWHEERATESTSRNQLQSWVIGFLSGWSFAAAFLDDPLDRTTEEAAWAWIDNYCQTHPLGTVPNAAREFATEITAHKRS